MTKQLLYINGLAIIFAVIHHTVDWLLTAMFWWTDRYREVSIPNFDLMNGPAYYAIHFTDQIAVVGVCVFLVVSGYFIIFASGRSQAHISAKTISSRILKLVPPYLFWSLFVFAMNYVFGDRLTWQEYLSKLITGGATAPYYYVPLLIQLFILSPLIVEAVKRNWKATLIVSVLLQVPVLAANYLALFRSSDLVPAWFNSIFLDWRVPAYLMWFTLGASIAWKVTAFKQLITQHKNKLLVIWLIIFVVSFIEWEILRDLTQREWIHIQVTASYRLFALVFIPLLLSVNLKNSWFTGRLTDISSRSYGIYLVHAPVMILTAKTIYHVAPALLQYTLLFQILLVAVSLGIPYLAMVTLERTPFRGLYSYIFG